METADMVKVAVSAAPYSIDKPYSYLVPDARWQRRQSPAFGSWCPLDGAIRRARA